MAAIVGSSDYLERNSLVGWVPLSERRWVLLSERHSQGIPFAAPPVGALRWKPPQPPTPWEGVRPCTSFGPVCPQPKSAFGQTPEPQNEDCLYLNVWCLAARPEAPRPVMVWIHGGGHTTGAGSLGIYDGANLARKGVVLVTINYRLGPLGFLAHPALSQESPDGVSGNYGVLDQIAALAWVQRNVAGFGGDPKRVTIFGESAGASSVTALMVCPQARSLFHRVIAESGFAGGYRKLREPWMGQDSAESMGEEIARTLGCAGNEDPLAALRAVPAEEMVTKLKPVVGLIGKGFKFRPVIDGAVLPDDPMLLFQAGRMADVPFLTGTNANEGTLFLPALPIKRPQGYEFVVRRMFPEDAEAILMLFPAAAAADVTPALDGVLGVSAFVAPARAAVRAQARRKGAPCFLYQFTRVPPGQIGETLGCFHAAEIAYVFANLDLMPGATETDTKLSATMSDCWVHFAETGDPNGAGLPEWPPYDAESDGHLEFGDVIRKGAGLRAKACDLFDQIGQKMRERKPAAAGEEPDLGDEPGEGSK